MSDKTTNFINNMDVEIFKLVFEQKWLRVVRYLIFLAIAILLGFNDVIKSKLIIEINESIYLSILINILKSVSVFLLFMLFAGFSKMFLELYNQVIKQNETVDQVKNTVSKELLSLQYGSTKHLQSNIFEKLLKSSVPLSRFLIKELELEPTKNLTREIKKSFNEAKDYKFSKACCVINNSKFIEIDRSALAENDDSIKMLKYFIEHKNYTKNNLIISRIFSFNYIENNPKSKTLNVSKEDYKYMLYLYLIANYYSGVNTYLHLFSDSNDDKKCLNNDYVSLEYYLDDNMHYLAYFSPSDSTKIDKLITVKEDMMLAKELENDFKSKLKKEQNIIDILNKNQELPDEFHLKINPENRKFIHRFLGLENKKFIHRFLGLENKKYIKTNLQDIVKKIPQDANNKFETRDTYKKAIEQFFI